MKDMQDKTFDFIYGMALRDATKQQAYKVGKGEKIALYKACPAKSIVKKYIDDLLDGKNPDFYKTAKKAENEFHAKQYEKFTFGNTQKLINMTVKYINIAGYHNDNYADLREKFRECHCPMDGVMVKKVIKELQDKLKKSEDKNRVKEFEENRYEIRDKDKIKKVKWRGFLSNPWGNMSANEENTNEQYELFQNIVRCLCKEKNLTPIEYDFIEWEPYE